MVITIRYTKPGALAILDSNGNQIRENGFDRDLNAPIAIRKNSCGENRYEGVTNIFQFYITKGCLLQVIPVDSIRV